MNMRFHQRGTKKNFRIFADFFLRKTFCGDPRKRVKTFYLLQ